MYALLAIGGITQIAMRFYVRAITGHAPAWASGLWLGLQIYQTVASITTLSIIASLHLAPPAVLNQLVSIMNTLVAVMYGPHGIDEA